MKWLLTLVTLILLNACATVSSLVPQRPQVELLDVAMGKVSLNEVQLFATLNVLNPNAFALNLAGIDYQVDALGLTLGKGSTTESLNLQPNVKQQVKLPLVLTTLSAVKFGQAYYASSQKQLPVTLQATVKFNSPVGPLSLNFQDVKDLKDKGSKK